MDEAKSGAELQFTANPFVEATGLSEIARMGSVTRALFSLVIAVALLATVISQPATAVEAEVAMASMPCCDDDCPQDPACDMACMVMMRCATGSVGLCRVALKGEMTNLAKSMAMVCC